MKLLKITKYIKNFALDSQRELVQIIFLFICVVFPSFVNLAEIIRTILGGATPTIENAKYYYLMISGNWTIGSIIALYVLLHIIRKSNKEKILNKGNLYHDKPYWWYWFCSKVLGYEKCNLILVPIHTQYKLVLRDTFEEYPFNESTFPKQECKIEVNRNLRKEKFSSKEINFIIQDTYPIYENQIPLNLREHNSISIKRHSNRFGERIYSKELIDTITEEIRSLNDGMTLNIFSTTNPKNTYEIIKNSIMLAERGNIKHVNVFQQNNEGEREFNNKPHKVI